MNNELRYIELQKTIADIVCDSELSVGECIGVLEHVKLAIFLAASSDIKIGEEKKSD